MDFDWTCGWISISIYDGGYNYYSPSRNNRSFRYRKQGTKKKEKRKEMSTEKWRPRLEETDQLMWETWMHDKKIAKMVESLRRELREQGRQDCLG